MTKRRRDGGTKGLRDEGKVVKAKDLKKALLKGVIVFTTLLLLTPYTYSRKPEVVKIWDQADHNAFTDLIRFKSAFYCTFREGKSHVPKDTTQNGKIRILKSADGKKWESVVLLENSRFDLRDSKLSITPDGRLMVLIGGSHYMNGILLDMMPHVSFSPDGSDFSEPVAVSIESSVRSGFDWIWRVTWKGNTGYGVVYQANLPDPGSRIRLLSTADGITYRQVAEFNISPLPNEATIRFDNDDNMMILLRREAGANGMLGISRQPYTDWSWKELGYRLGGPDFLILNTGKLCIGTRLYKPSAASTVIYITGMEGDIEKMIELPSGGDTSYPGLLIFKKRLWFSYYSSHEGKTSIYLAKIKVRDLLKG